VRVQFFPVRSEEPALAIRNALSFSLAMFDTAKATDEVGTSTMASTWSTSNQRRTMAAPMSGLF
jgi:hypothetical protein